jgi:quercetin dioxygenase-like cupin family protein
MLMHGTESDSGTPARLAQGVAALRPHARARAEVVDLAPGSAWSTHAPHGLAITCERGSVWITVEGDPEDHFIAAPGVFASPAHGRFAALALSPASLLVER